MRTNSKLALAALLGALVLSALASASASAAPCLKKAGSKNYQLCINGSAVEAPQTIQAATTISSNMTLGLPLAWQNPRVSIECTSIVEGSSSFVVKGSTEPLKLKFFDNDFEHCGLVGSGTEGMLKKCRSQEAIRFNELTGGLTSTEGMILQPVVGRVLAELIFSDQGSEKCAQAIHTWELAGSYECQLHEAGIEAVEHKLSCFGSKEHHLTVAEEESPIGYTVKLSLAGTQKGNKFSIYER